MIPNSPTLLQSPFSDVIRITQWTSELSFELSVLPPFCRQNCEERANQAGTARDGDSSCRAVPRDAGVNGGKGRDSFGRTFNPSVRSPSPPTPAFRRRRGLTMDLDDAGRPSILRTSTFRERQSFIWANAPSAHPWRGGHWAFRPTHPLSR